MLDTNPRFPFSFCVKRVKKTNGEVVYGADGTVTYETLPLAKVAMIDGMMQKNSFGVPVVSDMVLSMPCGYRTSTRDTTDGGDAVKYALTLHCPPFTTELTYDDIIEVTDYERTYKARVVKKVLFNWGVNIWYDEIKN